MGLKENQVAPEIENVVIQAGGCTLTLIPDLGGKISSIKIGSIELLQTPLNPCAPRTKSSAFSESDASGWDECLPSVGDCLVNTEAGPAYIPDHGDLWRISWEVVSATSDSASMRANCFSLPLQLSRTLILSETATGWRLCLIYTVANSGQVSVPWSWAAHPLFASEAGDRIHLPSSVSELRIEGSRCDLLGVPGNTIQWPVALLPDGSNDDLSTAKSAQSGRGDKLFAGPLTAASDGWCRLERQSAGLQLTIRFDPASSPYIGLWLCYGGWPGNPDTPGKKQVCVAMEPSTAPVDSLAVVGPWSRTLAPGETFTWPIELEIDRIKQKNEANPNE
jgi:galactose mutarotase-like enzyme